MQGQTRTFQEQLPLPGNYRFPLTTQLITATTQGTAHKIGEVRAASVGLLRHFFVSNQTGTAADLTFYALPSGGTLGADNREVTALSIPANTNVALSELVAGLYTEGTTFWVFASTASALMVGGFVEGVTQGIQ